MTSSKLRVGVLGAGAWAQHAHIPGWQRDPRCEVVVICDPEGDLARDFASATAGLATGFFAGMTAASGAASTFGLVCALFVVTRGVGEGALETGGSTHLSRSGGACAMTAGSAAVIRA